MSDFKREIQSGGVAEFVECLRLSYLNSTTKRGGMCCNLSIPELETEISSRPSSAADEVQHEILQGKKKVKPSEK